MDPARWIAALAFAWVAMGCSVLFAPDSPDIDPIDPLAPPPIITSIAPLEIFEGEGMTRPVPVVLTGSNFQRAAGLELSAEMSGIQLVDPLSVSDDGTLMAFTVRVPETPTFSDGQLDTVRITIEQGTKSDSIDLNVRGLDRLVDGDLDVDTTNRADDLLYSSIEIDTAIRVTGTKPLVLRATGAIRVTGTIDASGGDASHTIPGAPGPGGCAGGMGGAMNDVGRDADCSSGGPGGTIVEPTTGGSGGGGGGAATVGGESALGGAGGDVTLQPFLALLGPTGAQGAGGGGGAGSVTAPGSSGGGGGGVVALIAGGEVDVSADINLRGGVGGSDLVSAPCVGGGGGGSGGMLLVRGDTVELQANKALLSGGAAGGEDNPPAATCAGGAGALGIIRLDGELTNAPGSAKQGPSLDDPPSVHFGQDGMITLQASGDPDGQAFEVIVGDTTLDPLTDPDKEFTVLLSPGLNRVCIGVPNAEPDGPEEALNCYSIAFIPAPAL